MRLLRRLDFRVKAAIVTGCFLLPMALLLWAYLGSVQTQLQATRQERAGLALNQLLTPWLTELQKQRRAVVSGLAEPQPAAIEARRQAFVAVAEARPEGLDLGDALSRVQSLQQALERASRQRQGVDLFGPYEDYVQALNQLREEILDQSQLSLDPEQATYYLMLASSVQVPAAIEASSQSRSLAQVVAQEGGTPQGLMRLHGVWFTGQQALQQATRSLARAEAAEPGLAPRLPMAAARAAAQRFDQAAFASWFGESFDGRSTEPLAPGQAAVDALREVERAGLTALGELLAQRELRILRERALTLGVVALSLLAAAYLFHCFYLVIRGGLQEVGRHLQAMTQGDLTTRPRPWGRDEAAFLMHSLSAMQESLSGLVQQVRAAAQGLAHASHEIADASSDLSHRSEEAAANLQQSASAMVKLSQMVGQAAEHTQSVSGLAHENAQVADQGGQVIQGVVATMREVQASSSRIADIIGVIDGIAFQTSILALNASVEAARAGEQGRGFNVVASEVRALAQRSAQAAREIKTLITESVARIEAGNLGVGHAGENMAELVARAERMRQLMQAVYQGTQSQRADIGQVDASIQQLDEQTQQNAALVEQTAAAAASLQEQARSLVQEVARFRLPDAARA